MLQIIKKEDVYMSDHGWLTSRFLFSFAEYYDPNNLSFGNIRVFNDDQIAGKSGFPPHSHKEMEIVTIMHEGTLTHSDSMGNTRELRKGYVQRMSAGTGVTHSEMNEGDGAVHLYQLWFYPKNRGKLPSYEEKSFEKKEGVTLLVSPDGREGSVSIGADISIYEWKLSNGEELLLPDTTKSHVLLYSKGGMLESNGKEVLREGDQLRVTGEKEIKLVSSGHTQFLMIVSKDN